MIWYLITVAIIILDRITKYLIVRNIDYGVKIPVIKNFLYITHHSNTGAAWGILQNATIPLAVISGVVIIFIAVIIPKFNSKLLKLALSSVLGGAIGNQIGRILSGRVTDFIDTYFWGYNFPIFNVGDSFIVIGSIMLFYYMIFYYDEKEFEFLERGKEKNTT